MRAGLASLICCLVLACGRINFDPLDGGFEGSRIAYLKASNTGAGDSFGFSVAISADGSTIAVGAMGEDSSSIGVDGDQSNDAAMGSGALYVFVNDGNTWTQQAYLKASNTDASDQLGFSIALSADGNTLAAAATLEDSATAADPADNSLSASGAVYVFVRTGSSWAQEGYVKALTPGSGDVFGQRVALSADGNTLVVGAEAEDSAATGINGDATDNSAIDSGAAYVFVRSAGVWSQQAYIKASTVGAGDLFGTTVALSASGDILAVGALYEDSAAIGTSGDPADNSALESGAAYVFQRAGSTWSQQAYVKPSNTGANDNFGVSVALSVDGNTLMAGSLREASSATGVNGDETNNGAPTAGAAYVFVRSGGAWSQQAYIKASNTDANDAFGGNLALAADGASAAVCAVSEASSATGLDGDQLNNTAPSGAAYVYARGVRWEHRHYVKATNTSAGDEFCVRIALSGDGSRLVVGARTEDSAAVGVDGDGSDESATDSGAVYVYW